MSCSRLFLIAVFLLVLSACSSSRIVQPLNQSQWQTTVSFGGPLIKDSQDQVKIVPLSSITGAYGITQSITGFASWHLGSYLKDVYHIDGGLTQELVPPFSIRPGITYSGMLNLFSSTDTGSTRLFPQLDVNAYWILPSEDFVYLGLSNWFELNQKRAHNADQEHHWFTSINAGYTKKYKPYSATLEARYLAPFKESREEIIHWLNVEDRGSIGLYLSFSRTFQ